MEKGFIVSNYGISWNDHVPRFFCRGEMLASSFFGFASVPGSKCTTCGIIVLHQREPKMFEPKGRKCPHCGAVYVYSKERIGEDGSVRCQNCDKELLSGI
jgi:predicted Zn finger-like uncharacterized protein